MENGCKNFLVAALFLLAFSLYGCIGAEPEATPSPTAQATPSPVVEMNEEELAQEFEEIFGELKEVEEFGNLSEIGVTEGEWEVLES